jgi:hypothetical protein
MPTESVRSDGPSGVPDTAALTVRCRCRPGCLTWLHADDDIVITTDGAVLREHVEEFELFPQEPLFDLSEATS